MVCTFVALFLFTSHKPQSVRYENYLIILLQFNPFLFIEVANLFKTINEIYKIFNLMSVFLAKFVKIALVHVRRVFSFCTLCGAQKKQIAVLRIFIILARGSRIKIAIFDINYYRIFIYL